MALVGAEEKNSSICGCVCSLIRVRVRVGGGLLRFNGVYFIKVGWRSVRFNGLALFLLPGRELRTGWCGILGFHELRNEKMQAVVFGRRLV